MPGDRGLTPAELQLDERGRLRHLLTTEGLPRELLVFPVVMFRYFPTSTEF